MAGRHGCNDPQFYHFLQMLSLFFCLLSWISCTLAQPAAIPFTSCFSGNESQQLNVSTVYAQFFSKSSRGPYLNITVLGQNPQQIASSSDDVNNAVATTLFTNTEMLTFTVFENNSFFCATLRPPSPLPQPNDQGTYCPFNPGPFALSTSIEVGDHFELVTYNTRLHALDPFQNELLCIDLVTTPLIPGPVDSPYGHARIIFWGTVALAIGYWVVVGLARLVSAWGRGSTRNGLGVWARVESAGFILASALSGERFASSPALMRFCTPSLRDVIFHTQWCAALSMVAVQWPEFIYPVLSQTAWSTLSYNITLTQRSGATKDLWNPLSVQPYNPPSDFVDQLNDPNSPIYIDASLPNVLFQRPSNVSDGITSFAIAVGLQSTDLFGICLALFLTIVAATICLSLLVWIIDWIASRAFGGSTQTAPPISGTRSPRFSVGSKDMLEGFSPVQATEGTASTHGHLLSKPTSRFKSVGRPWWRLQRSFVSLHGSVLQGNLIRILILFHLPVTIFSSYQLTLGRSSASRVSVVLAALSFAIISVLIPILLIVRLTITNTNKLFDETWTLLSLGPLYNHYRHGSQLFALLLFATNVAFGVVIGCGQKSGTAQAIIILVIEVVSALGTSLWLPWGQGASMGLISFLFCVARIVIAVLLVILTPIVSVGTGAAQWVAYAILFILGLMYLAFFLMLVVKIIEAFVRMFGGIGFHRSRHVVDSGLLGALGLLGCCGSRRPPNRSRYRQPEESLSQPSTLPLSRPAPAYKDVTPTASGPPSVLRPEHAYQPYKEDSDDETGFIMGAWQPFPRPGYSPVEDPPVVEPPKSGFARVGGGRAHYDSPYAIASGSTQTFPSVERNPPSQRAGTSTVNDYSPPPTPSVASAAKKADWSLPPGAMPPMHVRTKSQTAIIEDASDLNGIQYVSRSRRPSEIQGQGQGGQGIQGQTEPFPEIGDDPSQPKKKHWYNLRKVRKSDGTELPVDPPVPAPDPEPGRSFVVVRKQRPGTGGSASGSGIRVSNPEPPAPEQQRSFTVIRGRHRDSVP